MPVPMSLYDNLQHEAERDGAHGFVSATVLREVVTKTRVQQYFESSEETMDISHETLAEFFSSKALKLFAIFLFARLPQYLRVLYAEQTTDEVFSIKLEKGLPMVPEDHIRVLRRLQWIIAPFWNTAVYLEPPDDVGVRNLFRKVEPQPAGIDSSSYGTIKQVTIADGHIDGWPPGQLFAMKSVIVMNDQPTRREEIVKREARTLLQRTHEYVIPVVLSYKELWRSSSEAAPSEITVVTITPWMDCSLQKFLHKGVPWIGDDTTRVVLRQKLYGLVYQILQGLAHLHRPQADGMWTCHHDLKPANILMDENKAVLADFGMAHLRRVEDGSGATADKALGTREYCPPETFNKNGYHYKDRKHGRAFDMWSVGCIMVEIAVIICHGWKTSKLQEFRDERFKMEDSCRPFPGHLNGDVPPEKVKPAYYNSIPVVDKWLEDLQASHFDDAAEAWKLARYLRLAVGMLCSEPGDRISSWEAVLDFYDVLHPDAKDSDRLSMAKEFVQAPHKPRTDGSLAETPLHRAARNGDFCRVVCLVDEGWKVDDTDVNHKTPIVLAKEAGHDLIESYLEIKRVKRDGTSSNIFPTAYVHEIEMDRRGFRTRTSSSKPPSSSIWTSSILHPEVQEIPQGAEEALQWFLGDELTMLYFYEYVKDETAWLYPASHMLAYMLRQRGNHVIVLDIGHDVVSTGKEIFTTFGSALLSCFTVIPPRNLPRTVQDLDNILEQYCPPSRPITVIMLGIKNRSFTTDILNIITFVLRHCVKSGNGLVNFKAFLTSEDWSAEIGSIVPAHQHVDLSELSNTVAWWGEDLNLGK